MHRWTLFGYTYKRGHMPRKISNLWTSNLGKLVVPNVFSNMDLVKALERYYDVDNRVIESRKGSLLLEISRKEIIESFSLNPLASVTIDFSSLCK